MWIYSIVYRVIYRVNMFLNWLESLYADGKLELDSKSCETIADELAGHIASTYTDRLFAIEVWEDGECGSISTYKS